MSVGPDVAYATQADVYTYGLPRGALGNPGRIVDSMLAATSTVTLNEHGFSTNDAITFQVTQGGSLSSPLVVGTTYYVIYLTDSTFQVASAPGGGAITLTADGVQPIVQADLPFDEVLLFYSRFVDGFLPAHAVPLLPPYPITVVAIVATLTAKRLQLLSGMRSGSMDEEEAGAAKQLERWSRGIPSREASQTNTPTNLAVTRARRNQQIGISLYGYGEGGLWMKIGGGLGE